MTPDHYIDKFTIQFSASGTAGNDIASILEDNKDEIQRVVKDVFDEHAPSDQVMVISKVQLHLGTLPSTDFQEKLTERLRALLTAELRGFFTREEVTSYLQDKRQLSTVEAFRSFRQYLFFGADDSPQRAGFFDPDASMLELFRRDKERLAHLIAMAWEDPAARLRLNKVKPETFSAIKDILPNAVYENQYVHHANVQALHLIKFYYNTGVFPVHAKSLVPNDLELLVRNELEKQGIQLIDYVKQKIHQEDFLIRIAETLSLETIKKIISEIPVFKERLQEWDTWESVLQRAGVELAALTSTGKIMILHYLTRSPLHDRIQGLHHFMRLGFSLQGMDFNPEKLYTVIASVRKEGDARVYALVQNQMPFIEILFQEDQLRESKNLVEWLSLLKAGTSVGNLSALLQKMHDENPEELARFMRAHWTEQSLRYSLAFNVQASLLAPITKRIWGSHASFSEWSIFETSMATAQKERGHTNITIRHLYFLYFEFLHRHGMERWEAERFSEWMLNEVEKSTGKKNVENPGKPERIIPFSPFRKYLFGENQEDLLRQMLRDEIKGSLPASQGFKKEDRLIFWDQVLRRKTMVLQVFGESTYDNGRWSALTELLKPSQRHHLLSILAPFQYEYVNQLAGEIQHYGSRRNKALAIFTTTATYQVLFQNLQESSYTISKKALAQVLVKFVFSEGNPFGFQPEAGKNFFNKREFQRSFPFLFETLDGTWNDWEKHFGVAPLSGEIETHGGVVVREMIQSDEKLQQDAREKASAGYDNIDLIQYYIKVGKLPGWAGITSESALSSIIERIVSSSPGEAAKIVSMADDDPEMHQRLTQLLSSSGMQAIQRMLEQDKDTALHYSNDKTVEAQHVEALLYFYTYHQWPWWYTATTQTSESGAQPEQHAVKMLVLQHHLAMFLEQVKSTGRETEMVPHLVRSVSLTDFLRIVNGRFPTASGFITTSFTLIGEVISNPVVADKLYAWVYLYLLKTPAEFSSRLFIHELINLVSEYTGTEQRELTATWMREAEDRMHTDNRFWVVKEILQTKADQPAVLLKREAEQAPASDLKPLTDFEQFAGVLMSYIRFGAISVNYGKDFLRKEEFLQQFHRLSPKEVVSLQALIRDSLSNRSLFDAFIRRSDSQMLDALIKVLAPEPVTGLFSWKNEMEAFLSSWSKKEDQTLIRSAASGALIGRLIQNKELPASLAEYIESVLDYLAYHDLIANETEFGQMVTALQIKGGVSPSFLQALEDRSFEVKSETRDVFGLLHYYLRSGELSGQVSTSSETDLRHVLEQMASSSPAEAAWLLSPAFEDPAMFRRLQPLLSPPALQEVQRIWEKEKGKHTILYSHDKAIELQRVEALLFFFTYNQWPWWYSFTAQVAESAVQPDEQELTMLVLQHHLTVLMEQIRSTRNELEIAARLIQGISLADFLRIIHVRFPAAAGFIVTTFTLISKTVVDPFIISELYAWVYRYIHTETEFSSRTFMLEFSNLVSERTGIDRKELTQRWMQEAEERMRTDNRFWVMKEILQALVNTPGTKGEEDDQLVLPTENDPGENFELFKESLLSYIRFGTIPLKVSKGFLQKEAFLEKFNNLSPQEIGVLQTLVRNSLSSRVLLDTFVRRADRGVLEGIVSILAPEQFADFIAWKNEMEVFLSSWSEAKDKNFAVVVAARALLALLTSKAAHSTTLSLYIEGILNSLVQQGLIINIVEVKEKVKAHKEVMGASPVFIKTLEMVIAAIAANERHALMNDLLKKDAKKNEPELMTKIVGKVPVQNAGIVILAPFLYRYFNALGMTADSQFKNKELSSRAVQLMEFLASGKVEMPEHGMLLNRILCGVSLQTPIDRTIELTTEERELSESLLRGVLQNWDKIKTESIDSLREGFLQRSGYLEETELGWSLTVDRKAMDILVDLIPWSFNLVKLSWMEKSLTTIWQSEQYRNLM